MDKKYNQVNGHAAILNLNVNYNKIKLMEEKTNVRKTKVQERRFSNF